MIFSKPISDLDKKDIEDFCAERIKEGFYLDYKKDFRNDLAKLICAFANTWGGIILIGVDEDGDGKPTTVDGIPFANGLDVRITNIVIDSIYPPVFVDKHVIRYQEGNYDKAIVVIQVPESNMTPHAVGNDRSDIYIRTDDRKTPIKRASLERILWLEDKRKRSEELRQTLYTNAVERLEKIYKTPSLWWPNVQESPPKNPPMARLTLSAIPLFPHEAYISIPELRDLFKGDTIEVRNYWRTDPGILSARYEPKMIQQGIIDYKPNASLDGFSQGLSYCELGVYGQFFYQEPLKRPVLESASQDIKTVNSIYYPQILALLDQFLEAVSKFYNEINVCGLVEIRLRISDIFNFRITRDGSQQINSKLMSHQNEMEILREFYKDELISKRLDILTDIIMEICFTFNLNLPNEWVEKFLSDNNRLNL